MKTVMRAWFTRMAVVVGVGGILTATMATRGLTVTVPAKDAAVPPAGAPGGWVRVIVELKEPAGHEVHALLGHEERDREATLRAFEESAHQAQESFLTSLYETPPTPMLDIEPLWIVNGLALTTSPDAIEAIRRRPDVVAVHPVEEIQLEPAFLPGVATPATADEDEDGNGATYGLKKIRWPEFRKKYPHLTGKGVVVGQIDTGIYAQHAEFKDKQIVFKSFVGRRGDAYDDNGHGTHISGTIAGNNPTEMAVGVAPGVQKLVVAKVFGAGGGATTDILIKAMQWMADPDGNPATADAPRLVSNSWGGNRASPVFRPAVQRWVSLGIFPCFAGGNAGPRPRTVGIPGGYPEAFAVGATDSRDRVAGFSSRGPTQYDGKELVKPDVCAPGVAVTSAWIPQRGGGDESPYRTISGTSMATPHVSGVIALMYQAKPSLTVDQVRKLLETSADPLGTQGKNNEYGSGRVNLLKLFEKLEAMP